MDEYLMKSELQERLVWVIERAMRPCPCCYFRVDHSTDPGPPAHQRRSGYDFGGYGLEQPGCRARSNIRREQSATIRIPPKSKAMSPRLNSPSLAWSAKSGNRV
jgi:hypothetical protein